MIGFTLRRLASALLLVVVVTCATFLLIFSDGATIARATLGESATQEAVEAKAVQLGLDQPVVTQYLDWVQGVLHGSLGNSYFTGEPVTAMLLTRLPVTLSLTVIVVLLTALISVLVGTLAAVRGGWLDRGLQLLAVAGAAVPGFIVAIILVLTVAVGWGALPATGYVPVTTDPGGWARSLVLPVLAILVGSVGGAAQQFRGAISDVLQQDFVRTLRSRGIGEFPIVARHVLRAAAAPGLTILSLQTIGMLGGVVLIEQVFALPGVGDLALETTMRSDVPVVMGCVVFTVLVVVVVNLVADVVGAWINPKVRLA
ncbi:ABC transporter permease [Krasilnikoviella flava]|uniref:Peptide/nickel transport system permease protein n=1 Tax=Krasilnikoviella flava TaxID=526729 RepID=A0A1T5K9B0_9MICO|nr:ABC transporter permease [Krasilnikoviella flava]SKC60105.1 peptide/nickel transport system permease protein [Krasilnikoviella flava]